MRRLVRIELRLTDTEAEELRRRAEEAHQSVSAYLRAQALIEGDQRLMAEFARWYLQAAIDGEYDGR